MERKKKERSHAGKRAAFPQLQLEREAGRAGLRPLQAGRSSQGLLIPAHPRAAEAGGSLEIKQSQVFFSFIFLRKRIFFSL